MAQGNLVDDKMKVELTTMERAWIKKALELQRTALLRSRMKEVPGSEIWTLRGREVEALTGVIGRF